FGRLIPPKRTAAAIGTIVKNWRCDYVVIQNSLYGYAALPQIRRDCPRAKILDLVHSIDDLWDQSSVTREVAPQIDIRIALSTGIRQHLLSAGTVEERIRVIRS